MHSDHIMIGDMILRQGRGEEWVVGRAKERTIHGAPTVEVLAPRYFREPEKGLWALLGDVSAKRGHGGLVGALFEFADRTTVAVMHAPGALVRRERKRRGVSQALLASHAGISVRSLREIERLRSQPRAITVGKLLAALSEFGG